MKYELERKWNQKTDDWKISSMEPKGKKLIGFCITNFDLTGDERMGHSVGRVFPVRWSGRHHTAPTGRAVASRALLRWAGLGHSGLAALAESAPSRWLGLRHHGPAALARSVPSWTRRAGELSAIRASPRWLNRHHPGPVALAGPAPSWTRCADWAWAILDSPRWLSLHPPGPTALAGSAPSWTRRAG